MAISFRRAPTVEPGDAVTSTQLAGLAAAFNDRLRSGLGDPTWRIAYYLFSGGGRSMRNPDSGGTLFAPQAEFFEQYQTLEHADGQWPAMPAGQPEGINVSSPLGAFVFGNESADIDNERDRIDTINRLAGTTVPTRPADWWHMAKMQRGAVDPSTGAIASPAMDTARLHMRIAYNVRSPFGNSYGGFLPIPEILGTPCAPLSDNTPINWEIKFTSLVDGSVVTYPGTCPEEPTHVGYILNLSDLIIVVLNNGDTDYYRRNEWIEGPYTGGGSLRRDVGGALDRALDRYVKDFRGTESQRATGRWNRNAFDFQAFLTRQYSLAPNRGVQSGEEITATYPTFYFTNDNASGTVSASGHAYADGYVLDAVHIYAEGVTGTVSVEIIDNDGEPIATVSGVADDAGTVDAVRWLPRPLTPSGIRARLASPLVFSGGTGTLKVECTELYPYKPNASDCYVLLRAASAKTGEIHGSGLEETEARAIWDTYSAYGVAYPGVGLPYEDAIINSNAVYDAFRRMSKCVRILSREQLIGYELDDGKSVLYFRRLNRINADSFTGIGPSRSPVASGDLTPGKSYSSRSGSVYYRGTAYAEGVPFTCTTGDRTYFGAVEVYEHDGILHTAPVNGLSNEWLLGATFKAYHPSESSMWKASAYSDYFAFSDRCNFYHPVYTSDLQQHFDYGESLSLAPESATGYRYAKGTNNSVGDVDRYKSCRIYEPDVEVDKAEVLIESGEEIIKLTLTGRLHYSDDAVGTIDRDITTWDTTALRAEAYRSTENAIREYLVWANTGLNAVAAKPGDAAYGSTVSGLPDNPYGTVFPSFFLTQLIPFPYDDGNDRQNSVDTPLLHDVLTQAELYLRAMCEGYVDGRTSEEYACASGISSWYDYSFPNLCFDAHQGQWLNPLATETTDYLNARQIRDDKPQGFGPYPNTLLSSEVFNQFSNAINLLTRVRVMLPMQFEAETRAETDSTWSAQVGYCSDQTPANDCSGPVCTGWYSAFGTVTDPPVTVTVPMTSAITAGSRHEYAYAAALSYNCTGTLFDIQRYAEESDYVLELVDPDAENAIPEGWRDQFEADGEMLFSVTETHEHDRAKVVTAGSGTTCGATEAWNLPGGTQAWEIERVVDTVTTCEVLPMQGTVALLDLGSVTLYGAFAGGTVCNDVAVKSRTIEPVTDDAFILAVPLVDL